MQAGPPLNSEDGSEDLSFPTELLCRGAGWASGDLAAAGTQVRPHLLYR